MNNAYIKNLTNFGYLQVDFTKEDLLPLINEVDDIKKNSQHYLTANNDLAGQIRQEYHLKTSNGFLNSLLLPYVYDYMVEYNLFSFYTVLCNDHRLALYNTWVNFQKKYEFNPVHTHGGIISFVIWLEVPYDMDEEINAHPGLNSNNECCAGQFTFHCVNALGKIINVPIVIDKNMIYKCIIFPSIMPHAAQPFYTTEGARISVSGNFVYNV
jgi:hypothetical protein